MLFKEELINKQLKEFYPKTSFNIICKGRVVNIGFKEITHVSKYGYEVVIYTKENQYRTRHSLQEIMNDLPVNDFFRVHKSHIVSLRFMNGIERRRVRVLDYYLPMSAYYKMQLKKSLQKILDKSCEFYF